MRACLGRTTLISLLVTSVQGPLRCQVLSRCHKDNDNQNHPCLPPVPTQNEQPSQDPELGLCWLCPLAGPSPSSPQEHFYLWIETLGEGLDGEQWCSASSQGPTCPPLLDTKAPLRAKGDTEARWPSGAQCHAGPPWPCLWHSPAGRHMN